MKPSKIENFQNRLQGSIHTTIIFCVSVRLSVCMGTTRLQQEIFFCKIAHTHTHTHTHIYTYICVGGELLKSVAKIQVC